MATQRYYIDGGRRLQWHPGNIIERIAAERAEINDYGTVLALKWIRTVYYTQEQECETVLLIATKTV